MLIILTGHGAALVQWGRTPPLRSGTVRRAALTWGCAAIGLVTALVVLRWSLEPALSLWCVQAVGLALVIRMGAYWAARAGAEPFGLFGANWRAWPKRSLALRLAAMLLWTALMLPFAGAGGSVGYARQLGLDALSPWRIGAYVLGVLTLAPILEEGFFRHYLLHGLTAWLGPGAWSTAGAAVVTSLAWSIGHLGLVEPWGLRLLHVFGLGLLLADTSRRHGLDAVIALHWLFNLALIPLLLALGD